MDPSSFPIGNIHLGIYDYTSLVFQIPPEVWCFGYVFRVQSYLLIRCLDAQGLVKDQRQNKSEHDEQFAFVSRHFCYFFHHGIWDSSPLNSLPFRGFFSIFSQPLNSRKSKRVKFHMGCPPCDWEIRRKKIMTIFFGDEVPGPNGGILPRIDLQTFQVSGAFGWKKQQPKKKNNNNNKTHPGRLETW